MAFTCNSWSSITLVVVISACALAVIADDVLEGPPSYKRASQKQWFRLAGKKRSSSPTAVLESAASESSKDHHESAPSIADLEQENSELSAMIEALEADPSIQAYLYRPSEYDVDDSVAQDGVDMVPSKRRSTDKQWFRMAGKRTTGDRQIRRSTDKQWFRMAGRR